MSERVTARLGITTPSGKVNAALELPESGGVTALYALAGQLADASVETAQQTSESAGRPATCRAGCDACCHHAVPLSPLEVAALRTLVASMPPAMRDRILARFELAAQHIEATGVGDLIRRSARGERVPVGAAYAMARVPCPFLEDRKCSIYGARPMVCREYGVSTPPSRCADPTPEALPERIPPALSVSTALAALSREFWPDTPPRTLLVWALSPGLDPANPVTDEVDPREPDPDALTPRSGKELLELLLNGLRGR